MNQQMPYPGNMGQQMPPQPMGYQDPYALPYSQPYQDPAAFQQPAFQDPYAFQQSPYQVPNPYPQQPAYQDLSAFSQQANLQDPNGMPSQAAYQDPALQPASAVPQQPAQQSPSAPRGKSGLAIAALVLGIIAAATSFMPIINNASFFIALVGLILGIVGLVQTRKGTRSGMGFSVAAIVLNVVACIVVLASQAFYVSVWNDAVSSAGLAANSSSDASLASSSSSAFSANSQDTSSSSSASTSAKSTTDMPLGSTVDAGNGLEVTVNSVTPGLKNYDGKDITAVNVTYKNTGSKSADFNELDWKAEDSQGVQITYTYYSEAENELDSGSLAPNGTKTGNVYFESNAVAKILYIDNLFFSKADISWLA